MACSTRIRLMICCSLALVVLGVSAFTQHARAELDPVPLLQQALRFRVTIHVNPRTGFMLPAYHCRRAKGGCDARLLEFAHYLKDAGDRFELDPWLLAAMAFRESGLNPFAVGTVGERGILQLHPKNPTVKKIRFVRDEWYRTRCKNRIGACQKEVIEHAAHMLASSLRKCGGNMEDALGMYNTGRCGGSHRYAERVFVERGAMMRAVGLEENDSHEDTQFVRVSNISSRSSQSSGATLGALE